MQEKIDDILGEPLVETEENKKMIRTPHGELPNYSVGERFGIGNRVRKKVKVLFGKNIFVTVLTSTYQCYSRDIDSYLH